MPLSDRVLPCSQVSLRSPAPTTTKKMGAGDLKLATPQGETLQTTTSFLLPRLLKNTIRTCTSVNARGHSTLIVDWVTRTKDLTAKLLIESVILCCNTADHAASAITASFVHNDLLEGDSQRNGSMSISMAAAGMLRSKAVRTSGCRTPTFPMTTPLAWTSAHRPGKKVGSGENGIGCLELAITYILLHQLGKMHIY